MADIPETLGPELLDAVRKRFQYWLDLNTQAKALKKKIDAGNGQYRDAQMYGELVGKTLVQAFEDVLTPDVLPDGKLYEELAQQIIGPALEDDHQLVANAAAAVQKSLNEKYGIGIRAQTVPVDRDRVDGIVKAASKHEIVTQVLPELERNVCNYSMHVADAVLEANIDFQGKAGRTPRVIRQAEQGCCKWCRNLAGSHPYPVTNPDVYKRHDYCRCVVEYDPGDRSGQRQDVYTKEWTTEEERAKIEQRQYVGQKRKTKSRAHKTVKNSELPNGLPIRDIPLSVVDKTDDFGNVLQRRVYGEDGVAKVDFDTTDHKFPKQHPTGAHKHIFDFEKRNPHGSPVPLTEEDLLEHSDIIQRGVNYHDEK